MINIRLNLRPGFVWKKKKYTVISKISSSSFLIYDIWSTGLDFCATDYFAGILSPIFTTWCLTKKQFCWTYVFHLCWFMINLHVCWSISVKSSFAKCLSYVVVNVPHNCLERTLNIVVIRSLLEQHYWKSYHNNDGSCSHTSFLSNCWF